MPTAHGADEVAQLLDDVEAALVADLPELGRRLDDLLGLYDGIPPRVDAFNILGIHGNESHHSAFLAWLLDPHETHALGDEVLRRFLELIGNPVLSEIARVGSPLRAWVQPELWLGDAGFPDLVMVVQARRRTIALVIEMKISAPLTVDAEGKPQTLRYVEALRDAVAVRKFVLERCSAASGIDAPECPLHFVFLHSIPTQRAETEKTGPLPYRNVLWRDVERALAWLVRELDMDAPTRNLIQQFRCSLLVSAAPASASLHALSELRRLRRQLHKGGSAIASHLRATMSGFEGEHVGS